MTQDAYLLNVKIPLSPLPPSNNNKVKGGFSWGSEGAREFHSGMMGSKFVDSFKTLGQICQITR